jgi:hypothetical protein
MRRSLTILVALAVGWVVGSKVYRIDLYDCGRHHGRLDGLGEAMEAIRAEFGQIPGSHEGRGLFSLKTSEARAVTIEGVKTLRVVP